jgi:hypothetical protein
MAGRAGHNRAVGGGGGFLGGWTPPTKQKPGPGAGFSPPPTPEPPAPPPPAPPPGAQTPGDAYPGPSAPPPATTPPPSGTTPPATPPAYTPAPMVERDEGVESRVASISAKDSPLMRQAETAGLAQANRRGLLNSSMAVGAAQNEAYKTALPIASQEAQQAAAANAQMREIAFQGAEKQLDRDVQIRIAQWNLSANEQDRAGAMIASMEQLYQTNLQSIMGNEKMRAEDRTKYLNSALAMRDRYLSLVEQMYNLDLKW